MEAEVLPSCFESVHMEKESQLPESKYRVVSLVTPCDMAELQMSEIRTAEMQFFIIPASYSVCMDGSTSSGNQVRKREFSLYVFPAEA